MRRLTYKWRRKAVGTYKAYIVPSRYMRYRDGIEVNWVVHQVSVKIYPFRYRWSFEKEVTEE